MFVRSSRSLSLTVSLPSSSFLTLFRPRSDIKITPWANGKRSFEYTKPLSGSVGPSSAKCYFEDEIIHEDADGWYGVVTITKTPDVPSGKR